MPNTPVRKESHLDQINFRLKGAKASEKIMNRAIEMQSSEELHDVVQLIIKEFNNLWTGADSISLFELVRGSRDWTFWSANKEDIHPKNFELPYRKGAIMDQIGGVMLRKRKSFQRWFFNKRSKDAFFKHLHLHCDLPAERIKTIQEASGVTIGMFFFKNSAIQVTSKSDIDFSKKEIEFIRQIGRSFEYAYARFLDLQKAEAQAREAQIEAALEKVRSASLSMRHTSELQKVINTVGEQFRLLELDITGGVFICINKDVTDELFVWGSGPTAEYAEKVRVPQYDKPISIALIRHIQKGSGLLVEKFSRKEKIAFFKHLFKYPPYNLTSKAHQKEVFAREGGYTRSCYTSEHTSIFVVNHHGRSFSDEDNRILTRFAKVFEQSYRRFLDLQKAEAQTREAQIEAALERVRSKSMAMHKSEDLADLSLELVKQVHNLGIETWFCAFNINDGDEKGGLEWGSNGQGVFPKYRTPREGIFLEYYNAGQRGETLYVKEIGEEECPAHYEYLCTLPGVGEQLLKIKEAGIPFPISQIDHVAFFKYGYILFITFEPVPQSHDIFKRFAKVFEQTYTRFLDLQKAEAQAREAQIETALEKVRSRTMGMHNSEELKEVIQLVYEQFVQLGFLVEHTGFIIDYKNREEMLIWLADPKGAPAQISIPYFDAPHWNSFIEAKKTGKNFFVNHHTFKEKNRFYRKLFKHIPELPEQAKEFYLKCPGLAISTVLMENVGLYIENFNGVPYSDEENNTLLRFGKVFQQTYTRFLDLQKAEAQSREAQIEAALERVRAASMAMHQSEDLNQVIATLFNQLEDLGLNAVQSEFVLFDKKTHDCDIWASNKAKNVLPRCYRIPHTKHAFYQDLLNAWKTKTDYKQYQLTGRAKSSFEKWLFAQTDWKKIPHSVAESMRSVKSVNLCWVTMKHGILEVSGQSIVSDQEFNVIKRFAKVFEQTYTRFLDIQKAEEQARESQIEAALERVRAQTMAMHNSDDIGKCIYKMFEELTALGVDENTRFGIGILNHDNQNNLLWTASKQNDDITMHVGNLEMTWHPLLKSARQAWKKQVALHTYVLEGQDLRQYYQMLNDAPDYPIRIDLRKLPKKEYHYGFVFEHGFFYAFCPREFSADHIQITKRFTSLFGQTYRRYLDLVRAEEQAREAQIEAALERIRSRTMAMRHSHELREVVAILYQQAAKFSLADWGCNIEILNPNDQTIEIFLSENEHKTFDQSFYFKGEDHPVIKAQWDNWRNNQQHTTLSLIGRSKTSYDNYIFKHTDFVFLPEEMKAGIQSLKEVHFNLSRMKYGFLVAISMTTGFKEEQFEILDRFAHVFEQTYTRFLDLERAEGQAREAQIEAALERTRTQSMLMQHSDELDATSKVFHEQLRSLGVDTEFSYVWLPDEDKDEHQFWVAWNSEENGSTEINSKAIIYPLDKTEPYTAACFQDWESDEQVHVHRVEPGEVIQFFSAWEELLIDAKNLTPDFYAVGLFYAEAFMKYGCFGINIKRSVTEEEKHILQRFSVEFERTYTRFLDLQKAEAQARESQIEAALEKVRSRSLEMHKPEELVEVVKVIVEKLKELDVVLDANGVVLCTYFQDSKDILHWIVSPDYRFAGRYLLPYFDHPILRVAWQSKESGAPYFSQAFSIEEKNSFWEHAFEHSDYKHFPEDFKQWVFQNDKHTLSFAWQKNSAILIPSHTGIVPTDSEREILIRFSTVFEQAYIRFMDLQVKEQQAAELLSEKQRLEKTLSDLQATQQQLIHAEKMASLGELTAGIAHEIQNPLNFVNNFSEVSNELIDEMNEEIEKGDLEEAKYIAADIKQNLDKILHHGKRADGIVKGMLQHSRSSSGKKEPTDINILADEYLRLAYHGLRAKDKSFNATLETEFDQSLGKVNMIAQDIGRVMLNLITNAFHAVKERSLKSNQPDYKPTVLVRTKKEDHQISIAVKDNGSGIPDSIKQKIFQPFFTTKPTGEGTGLGLSLSYDIVKAHGGELSCSSRVNEGTEFIIKLPVD